jgi:class 3 adenylate cyclase
VSVAYQVFGMGPKLLVVPGWASNVDANRDLPGFADLLRRLSAFARVVIVDRRGTGNSNRFSAGEVPLLERHHALIRAILARYRGRGIDTAGDGFFATFDGPARAVRAAQAIIKAVGALGRRIRADVHTGEVQTIAEKVGGMGVIIGARIGAMAGPDDVLTSATVKDLTAGSGLTFEATGEHELKGVPDRWRLYRVVG